VFYATQPDSTIPQIPRLLEGTIGSTGTETAANHRFTRLDIY